MADRIRLKKYLKNYHSNSLFFRNLLLILLLVVVPLVGLSFFTFRYNRNLLDEEIKISNGRSLFKMQGVMDNMQSDIARIAAQTSNSPDVHRFINADLRDYPDYRQIEILQTIKYEIKLMIHSYIFEIYVYSEKNNYLITSTAGGALEKWVDLSVHEKIKQPEGEWLYDYKYSDIPDVESKPADYLTFYRKINLPSGPENNGTIAVLLDQEKMNSSLMGSYGNDKEIMFILNKEGTILFSSDKSWMNQPFNEIITGETIDFLEEKTAYPILYNDSPYIFSFLRSEKNDWIYGSLLSREEYYSKQAVLQRIMLLSLIFSLSVSIAAAFLISLYVFKPIHDVIGMLENPRDIPNLDNYDNEMKFIAGNIMQTYDEYQQNREEIENRAAMLKTARVRALQAQINPHFLNNTLQLVNWTIMKETGNEESEAIEILENLADLVRVNMETKYNLTSLAEEADYVNKYMSIQKKRYGSKIRYEQFIPEQLEALPVLKMLLQPLVENAIYHGLKKSPQAGIITLKALRESSNLIITVEDNGIGMDISDMTALNHELSVADSLTDSHIGLVNVSLRLRLVFGPQASLQLSTRQGGGVIANVRIPLMDTP